MTTNPFLNSELESANKAFNTDSAADEIMQKYEANAGYTRPGKADGVQPEIVSYVAQNPESASIVEPDINTWDELLGGVKDVFDKMKYTVDFTNKEVVDRNYLKGLEVFAPNAVTEDMRNEMDETPHMQSLKHDSIGSEILYGTIGLGAYLVGSIAKTPDIISSAIKDAAVRQTELDKAYGVDYSLAPSERADVDTEYNLKSLGNATRAMVAPFLVLSGGAGTIATSSAVIASGDAYQQLETVQGLDKDTARYLSMAAGVGVAGLETLQVGMLTKGLPGMLAKAAASIPSTRVKSALASSAVKEALSSKTMSAIQKIIGKDGLLVEVAKETGIEGVQAVVTKGAVDVGKGISEDVDVPEPVKLLGEYSDTFFQEVRGTGPAMFGMVALREAIGIGSNHLYKKAANRMRAESNVDATKSLLEGVTEATDRTALKGKSPVALSAILEDVVTTGRSLYLRPQKAEQLYVDNAFMFNKLGYDADKISEAVDRNEDVELRVSELAANVSIEELMDSGVVENSSIDPELPSKDDFDKEEILTQEGEFTFAAQKNEGEERQDTNAEGDNTGIIDPDDMTLDEAENVTQTGVYKTQKQLDKERAGKKAAQKKAAKIEESKVIRSERKRMLTELNEAGIKGQSAEGIIDLIDAFAERHGVYENGPSRAELFAQYGFKKSLSSKVEGKLRGALNIETGNGKKRLVTELFPDANAQTVFHELGHAFLTELETLVNVGVKDKGLLRLWEDVQDYTLSKDSDEYAAQGYNTEEGYLIPSEDGALMVQSNITQTQHEIFADGLSLYIAEGKAPTAKLARVFSKVIDWIRRAMFPSDGTYAVFGNSLDDESRSLFARVFAESAKVEEYADIQDTTFTKAQIMKVELPDTLKDTLNGIDANMKDSIKASFHFDLAKTLETKKKVWMDEASEAASKVPLYRVFHAVKDADSTMKVSEADLRAQISDAEYKMINQRNHRIVRKNGGGLPVELFLSEFGYADINGFVNDMRNSPSERDFQKSYRRAAEVAFFDSVDVEQFFLDHADKLADYHTQILNYFENNLKLKSRANAEEIKLQAALDLEDDVVRNVKTDEKTINGLKRSLKESHAAMLNEDMESAHESIKGVLKSTERLKDLKRFRKIMDKTIKTVNKVVRTPAGVNLDEEFRNLYIDTAYRYGFLNDLPEGHKASALNVQEVLSPKADEEGNTALFDTSDLEFEEVLNGEPGRKNYQDLPIKKARQVFAALKEIETMGVSKLRSIQENLDAQDAFVAESYIVSTNNRPGYKVIPEENKVARKVDAFLNTMTKPIFAIRKADGGVSFEGKAGELERSLYDPLERAEDRKTHIQRELYDIVNESLNTVYSKLHKNKNRAQAGIAEDSKVRVPAIMQANGQDWTFERVFMMAANRGNPYNLKAILDGYGLSVQEAETLMENTLDVEDMEAVQAIWDAADKLYGYVNEEYKKENYRNLNRVDASSFVFKGKGFKGGYFPVKFDTDLELSVVNTPLAEIARENAKFVKSGNTVSRVGTGGRPVKLSMDVVRGYFSTNTHYAAYASTMKGAFRLLDNEDIRGRMVEMIGKDSYKNLYKNMQKISRPESGVTGIGGKTLEKARSLAAIQILGINPKVAVKQPLSFFNFAQDHGYKVAMRGLKDYHSNRAEWDAIMDDIAPMMKNRAHSFDRHFYEQFNQMELRDPSLFDNITRVASSQLQNMAKKLGTEMEPITRKTVQDFAFAMIRSADRNTVRPLWVGKFQDVLEKTGSEKVAAREASKAIATTQPTSRLIDMSLLERDRNGVMRAFTSFMTFRLLLGNRLRYHFQNRALGNITNKEYFNHILNEVFIPVSVIHGAGIGVALSLHGLSGNPVDDEDMMDWLKEFGADAVGYSIGTVPVVSDVYSTLSYKLTSGNFGRQSLNSLNVPAASYVNAGIDASVAMASLLSDFDDDGKRDQAIWRVANTIGFYYGLPVVRVAKDIKKTIDKLEE